MATRADLEAQHGWLQAVLDQMPELVILFDTRGRIRFFNQAALALSVGETGQVDQYGNPINYDLRFPSGEPLPPMDSPIVRTIARGEVIRDHEILLRQRDGRLVAVRGSAAPVCGPNGERLGSAAVYQDISALKALEREREEWISVVTHDLRQPVTIILGYAERLARLLSSEGTPDQRKAVEAVLAAARNLSRMIGDLLDASRIETRRPNYVWTPGPGRNR
jgi:signal transduction histidine kinase